MRCIPPSKLSLLHMKAHHAKTACGGAPLSSASKPFLSFAVHTKLHRQGRSHHVASHQTWVARRATTCVTTLWGPEPITSTSSEPLLLDFSGWRRVPHLSTNTSFFSSVAHFHLSCRTFQIRIRDSLPLGSAFLFDDPSSELGKALLWNAGQ